MTLPEEVALKNYWVSTLVVAIVLTLTPLTAEEVGWFSEPRVTPVQMLQGLFRSPVSDWPGILKRHEYLLTEQFLDNVDQRIVWGLENGHFDDAERFRMLRRFARQAAGFKLTRGWADRAEGSHGLSPLMDMAFVGHDDFTLWPDEIAAVRHLLSEETYDAVAGVVEQGCRQGNYYLAAQHALMGDIIAAELGFTGDLRLRVVLAAGTDFRPNVPMDLDPRVIRDGYILGTPLMMDSYWREKYQEAMKRR